MKLLPMKKGLSYSDIYTGVCRSEGKKEQGRIEKDKKVEKRKNQTAFGLQKWHLVYK